MKAANVFIHKDEFTGVQSVKIGDLGVAKLLDSNTCFATTVRHSASQTHNHRRGRQRVHCLMCRRADTRYSSGERQRRARGGLKR